MKTMICVENLGYSLINYQLIHSVNEVVERRLDEVSFVPMEVTNQVAPVKTAVLTPSELGSFNNGLVLSTSIKHLPTILGCPGNVKVVQYLYDLEWMFQPMPFSTMWEAFNTPGLVVVARSSDYNEPFSKAFGRQIDAVLPEAKLEELWNLL